MDNREFFEAVRLLGKEKNISEATLQGISHLIVKASYPWIELEIGRASCRERV